MGEAKRRGTKEQRIAQAVERRKVEDARREEARLLAIREKHDLVRALPAEERKQVILADGGGSMRRHAFLAAALAASAPLLVVASPQSDGVKR